VNKHHGNKISSSGNYDIHQWLILKVSTVNLFIDRLPIHGGLKRLSLLLPSQLISFPLVGCLHRHVPCPIVVGIYATTARVAGALHHFFVALNPNMSDSIEIAICVTYLIRASSAKGKAWMGAWAMVDPTHLFASYDRAIYEQDERFN
jgi:hypothetical protein